MPDIARAHVKRLAVQFNSEIWNANGVASLPAGWSTVRDALRELLLSCDHVSCISVCVKLGDNRKDVRGAQSAFRETMFELVDMMLRLKPELRCKLTVRGQRWTDVQGDERRQRGPWPVAELLERLHAARLTLEQLVLEDQVLGDSFFRMPSLPCLKLEVCELEDHGTGQTRPAFDSLRRLEIKGTEESVYFVLKKMAAGRPLDALRSLHIQAKDFFGQTADLELPNMPGLKHLAANPRHAITALQSKLGSHLIGITLLCDEDYRHDERDMEEFMALAEELLDLKKVAIRVERIRYR